MSKRTETVYPLNVEYGDGSTQITEGINKLEYFAGLAMSANLSAHKDTYPDPKNLAKKSVQYAKALIEELDKEEMEYLSQFGD
jgi:aromatic ring-opening dioxygenase LigB subunit